MKKITFLPITLLLLFTLFLTPATAQEAVDVQITHCSGTRLNQFHVNVIIKGSISANRSVTNVRLTAFANGLIVAETSLGDFSAGQSKNFRITGTIATAANTLECYVEPEEMPAAEEELVPEEEYPSYPSLTVSNGDVDLVFGGFFFIFAEAGQKRCAFIFTNINGVFHKIHNSKWQRREDATSPWVDIPGTKKNGLCSYKATLAGEYRILIELTVGEVKETYVSRNTFTVDSAAGAPAISADVNGDGTVNIQDLVSVASNIGQTGQNDADVNGDGTVDILDLVLVAGALDTGAAAPALYPHALEMLTTADIRYWMSQVGQVDTLDARSLRGVEILEHLLAILTPKETVLLPNYPNPFNPETWIPYRLAKPTEVTVSIYDVKGIRVRELSLGHQPAGIYQTRSRAAYWDGKNELGEPVASGVYFYTLTAGNFSATRKMLIRK